MSDIIQNGSMLITAIGLLAFVISIITEVSKKVPGLKDIPTDLVVFILSIVLTVIAYFAYSSYAGLSISWYMAVASVIAGFIVAFVSMFGWTKLSELYNRFKK